jgi:tetratricopeptide (TPR) repeat protein
VKELTILGKSFWTLSFSRSAARRLTVIGILLIAFILRLIYAHNLPLNQDEVTYYDIAKNCLLHSGGFQILTGTKLTPILTIYLIALGYWAGQGSVFVIRLVFVFLSILGLGGLFVLSRSFFGYRVAVLALIIASIDRHLVAFAPWMLDVSFIFLVPWIILQFHRCLDSTQKGHWLMLGLLFGIGYNYYGAVLLLVLPLVFLLFFYRRLRYVLASPAVYLGAGLFLMLILPNFVWNLRHDTLYFKYLAERSYQFGFGLTPRFLLLYIGDLLVSFKNSVWILFSIGNRMYAPHYLPCHWFAGTIYLACLFYSLRFYRNRPHFILLVIVLGAAIPVSLIYPAEPWNNFWYANTTIYPIIILTAFSTDKLLRSKWTLAVAGVILLYLVISLCVFLAGPKWGYMSPNWEKAYIGKISYLLNEERFKKDNFAEARELATETVVQHPESALAHYYRGLLASETDERANAFKRALEIDPYNPLIFLYQVEVLIQQQEWLKARNLLYTLLASNQGYYQVRIKLAYVEYKLGNYRAAEEEVTSALAMKPDAYHFYELLFFIRDAMGKGAAAEEALKILATRHFERSYEAYFTVAMKFALAGQFRKANFYAAQVEKALLVATHKRVIRDPYFVVAYNRLGSVYMAAGNCRKAIENYRRAIELNPDDAAAHNNLAVAYYYRREYNLAIRHCDRAMELGAKVDPAFLEALDSYPYKDYVNLGEEYR